MQSDTRPPTSSRDATVASTVIRAEALSEPGVSAPDVLSRVPGVQLKRTGAKSDLATASIRGATAAQTPVYLAGIRVNDDVSGSADLSTVPLWMLDRVEVFRGNAPVQADRLGIGGAVFFEPRLPSGPELRLGQMLGSFHSSGTWLSAAVGSPDASALLAVRRESARNDYEYVNDAGTRFERDDDDRVRRDNADFANYDTWTIGRYRVGRSGRVVAMMNAFDREQGVTGFSVIPATASRARVRRQLVGVSSNVPCSGRPDRQSRCRVELATSGVLASTSLTDPDRELSLGATRLYSRGRRASQSLRWQQRIGPSVTVTASGDQGFEQLVMTQDQSLGAFAVNARRSVTRAVASVSVRPWRPLTLVGLSALECHSTRGPGSSDTCGVLEPVGRLGAEVELVPWLAALGNVGRYVRVPTLGELYGMSPLVRGNPELLPEKGVNADLGVRLSGVGQDSGLAAYVDAFAFRRTVSDLVSYRRSFRQLIPFNVGEARVQGLELQSQASWRRNLKAELSLTLLDPRDTSPDRSLENDILPLLSRMVLVHHLEGSVEPGVKGVDRLALGLRFVHRSSRYQDPAGLIVIPHHTTADLIASALVWHEQLALRASVENLFDQEHWDLVGLALPGRAFYFSGELVLR